MVISCFALNLLLGYLAMLVIMTYSFELFFSVIVGLVAGHSFFNWNSAVGESIDPCCSNQGCNVSLSSLKCCHIIKWESFSNEISELRFS